MKRALFTLTATTLLSIQAQAQFVAARVNSVNRSHSQIMIESTKLGTLQKGNVLLVNDSCSLEIIKRNKTKAVLSTADCNTRSTFARGQNLSLRLDVEEGGTVSAATTPAETAVQSERAVIETPRIESETTVNGVRLYLATAAAAGVVTAKGYGESSTGAGTMESNIGLGAGYAYVKNHAIGVSGRGIYSFYGGNTKAHSLLIDGNGTYGLSDKAYLFAGLNAFKLIPEDSIIEFDMGIGVQGGVGVQFTKHIGVEAGLSTHRGSANVLGATVDLSIVAFDLALTATF